jgi:hypothetical protein
MGQDNREAIATDDERRNKNQKACIFFVVAIVIRNIPHAQKPSNDYTEGIVFGEGFHR